MKKVLIYGISQNVGGIEALIFNVISNIGTENMKFDIITYYDKIQQQDEYEKMGVNVFKFTSKRENPAKNKQEFIAFFEQHANEYDVVWCNLAELINIDILKYAKKYGIKKRIIHSHSNASTRGKLLTTLHKLNRLIIGNIATDFWACSVDAGKWFYNDKIINSDKFKVIINAIDTKKFLYNQETREKKRRELGINENEFVLGHVGRFCHQKNTPFLIDILNEVLKIKPETKLLLIGDGEDRELVENKIDELNIRDKVILTGTRTDVNELLNAMDAFILPSRYEGLGIVLIEAQVNGLKCYASNGRVPRDAELTELMNYIDLEAGASAWAEKIVSDINDERKSMDEKIADAGYEIKEESQKIKKLIEE